MLDGRLAGPGSHARSLPKTLLNGDPGECQSDQGGGHQVQGWWAWSAVIQLAQWGSSFRVLRAYGARARSRGLRAAVRTGRRFSNPECLVGHVQGPHVVP